MMNRDDKGKNHDNLERQELSLDEIEDVNGGGIKEIVAATTLAAMAMTGNTVSAFNMASALAEGSAHVEAAPAQEAYGGEYAGVMSSAIQFEAEPMEAQPEEVSVDLGDLEQAEAAGDGEAVEETREEASDEAASALTFKVGNRRVLKLNELARSLGIDAAVEAVGVVNDDDAVMFSVHNDEDGDLAIEFLQSFDVLEIGLVTADDFPVVTLTDAAISAEAPAEEESAPVEVAEAEESAEAVEEAETEADIAIGEETEAVEETEAMEETEAPDEDGEQAEDDGIELIQAIDSSALAAVIGEIMDAQAYGGLVELLDAVNARLFGAVNEDALRGGLLEALTARMGGELSEAELLDAIDASFVRTQEDPEIMNSVSDEERAELLARIINQAVAEKRSEGVYTALDNTMHMIAFNQAALADPETGDVAVENNAIVELTYAALDQNFDLTRDQMLGAIGAAASRAEESGEMTALYSDSSLAAMSSENKKEEEFIKYGKKGAKTLFDSTMDSLAVAFPEFKPFASLLKGLGGIIFDLGNSTPNPNAEVLARINELDSKIDECVENLKNHDYNVVQLADIGDKYHSVADKAETIRVRIGNYERDTSLTAREKRESIANLYDNSEFLSLESAMNGAYRCFTSESNDIFENQNIFDAAYRRACEEVMFSGEAIDLTVPYLTRQLKTYVSAYAIMAEVYDAYEEVYGASKLMESQEKMCLCLSGCDLNGKKVCKSVIELYQDFFTRDRFVFVDKSNTTRVALNRSILIDFVFGTNCVVDASHYGSWVKTPDYMHNVPLTEKQVDNIASYCADKNIMIFDLLFNRVGFLPNGTPMVDNSAKIAELRTQIAEFKRKMTETQQQTMDAQTKLAEYEAQLEQVEQELNAYKAQYPEGPNDSISMSIDMDLIMLAEHIKDCQKKINYMNDLIANLKAYIRIHQDELSEYEDKIESSSEVLDRYMFEVADSKIRVLESDIMKLLNEPTARVNSIVQEGMSWTATENLYLCSGTQDISRHRPGGGKAWIDYQAVNATKVGASRETITIDKCDINAYGVMNGHNYRSNHSVLFFQPRG